MIVQWQKTRTLINKLNPFQSRKFIHWIFIQFIDSYATMMHMYIYVQEEIEGIKIKSKGECCIWESRQNFALHWNLVTVSRILEMILSTSSGVKHAKMISPPIKANLILLREFFGNAIFSI